MVLFGLCTVSSFSFLEGGARPFYSLLDRGYIISGSWGLFLYSNGNFSGPESCFVSAVFAFKIKVLIIFENNTMKLPVNEVKFVCGLGIVLLFNRF